MEVKAGWGRESSTNSKVESCVKSLQVKSKRGPI